MEGIKGVVDKLAAELKTISEPGGAKKGGEDFSKVLKESIEKVNSLKKEADVAIEKFAAGKASMHETMIAIEKAGLSFQLMLQVRNKIVTAYEEIMRTQV